MIRLPGQFPTLAAGLDASGLIMVKVSSKQGKQIDARIFFKSFPEGYYEPEFTRRNLADKEIFQDSIRTGLAALKTEKTKRISIILPDSVSRVFLLDFEDIPSKRSDLESLLRHKVKKILPFDSEMAALSYRLSYKEDDLYSFLAGFMYRPVAIQFEDYLQEIGIHCGLIDTRGNSLINLFNFLEAEKRDRFYIFIDSDYMTLAAEKDSEIFLYRGKSLASSKRKDFIQREILQSIMFLFDRFGEESSPEAILLSNRSGIQIDRVKIGKKETIIPTADYFDKDIRISFADGSSKEIDKELILPVIGAAVRSME
jgi:hypothetical protein